MEVVKKPLADRLADVFGALGGGTGAGAPAWGLRVEPAAFKAGRAVTDAAADSDEEAGLGDPIMADGLEDSEDMDVCRPRAEDSDDEGGSRPGAQQPCELRAAFRRQFENEEEEDEYDRFADAGWQGSKKRGDRPAGDTEVLDNNVFDRMSDQRAAQARAVSDMTPDMASGESAAQRDAILHAAAVGSNGKAKDSSVGAEPGQGGAAVAPMDIELPTFAASVQNQDPLPGPDDIPDLIPSIATTTTSTQPPRRSVFDRLSRKPPPDTATAPPTDQPLTALTIEALPDQGPDKWQTGGDAKGNKNSGSGNNGNAAGGGAGSAAPVGNQTGVPGGARQGKRVRFQGVGPDADDDDSAPTAGGRNGGRDGGRGLSRGFLNNENGGRGGGRGGGRRKWDGKGPLLNWQRPGYVPDHVKHPERYTVYDLGETLTVGGGDQGVTSSSTGDAAAMRQAANTTLTTHTGTASTSSSSRLATTAAGNNTDSGSGAVGQGEGRGGSEEADAAPRAPLAVGAGAVTFRSRSQRAKDTSHTDNPPSDNTTQPNPATTKPASRQIGGRAMAGDLWVDEPDAGDVDTHTQGYHDDYNSVTEQDTAGGMMAVDGAPSHASVGGGGVGAGVVRGGGGGRAGRRQFRSKAVAAAQDIEAEVGDTLRQTR